MLISKEMFSACTRHMCTLHFGSVKQLSRVESVVVTAGCTEQPFTTIAA